MKKFIFLLFLLLCIGAAGGVYWLGTWDVPLEQETVYKPLPASNFGEK